MKNITVSVDDNTYHRSRVRAAEMRTSVSALVKGFLIQVAGEETTAERKRREEREIIARIHRRQKDFSAGNRLNRDELHDRHAFR
jgi:VIT1/CCC1 family predicted Fe2+/Mn2+ transporter